MCVCACVNSVSRFLGSATWHFLGNATWHFLGNPHIVTPAVLRCVHVRRCGRHRFNPVPAGRDSLVAQCFLEKLNSGVFETTDTEEVLFPKNRRPVAALMDVGCCNGLFLFGSCIGANGLLIEFGTWAGASARYVGVSFLLSVCQG